ncbi:MAG: cell envelope integrity protein TolA [Proteobacteria bacterium]|nr:cell envelope integrity protein TolA [Pseudomonadota bacterium]
MSHTYNNLVIYNGYPISIVVAVTFHSVVLAALIYFQANSKPQTLNLVQPTVIKALLIDENPQLRNERILERQRLERLEQQRIARDREQQTQRDADAEAERLRQRSALIERRELERLQAERLQREREQLDQDQLAREAEQRRQRELADAEQQRLRQQVADDAAAIEVARTEFELMQSGTALIQQVVQDNWSRPPSARNGMQAILRIEMLPTGEVTSVTITKSSNDPAFDRSAETAVYRAAPFRELRALPINVFNANFRTFSLIFEPEDLLN